MFELFRKRDFSDFITDTFSFFKLNGKHYLKSYFTINGGFLILLSVLLYFVFKIYFEVLVASSGLSESNYLSHYFDDNFEMFAGTFSLFILLIIVISLISVAYPILYLELFAKKGNTDFNTSEITDGLKQNAGRLSIFFLGFTFIVMPVMMVMFFILMLLCLILIGIPLLMIACLAFFGWSSLSLYCFITEKTDFFSSFKKGFSLLKQKFWSIVGASFVIIMMIQFIQIIITMIPSLVGLGLFFTSSNPEMNSNSIENNISISIFIFIFGVLISALFNNMIMINQGIIYYSLKEENENNSIDNQIDLIGLSNE